MRETERERERQNEEEVERNRAQNGRGTKESTHRRENIPDKEVNE